MSDLSKIKVGSTTYDIKDAVAREEFDNYLPVIDPIVEVNPENYNTASLYFKDDKTSVNLWDGEPDSGRSLDVSILQDSNAEHPVTLYLGSNSADFQTGSSIILDSDGNITISGNDEIALNGETYSILNPSAFRNALELTAATSVQPVSLTAAVGTATAYAKADHVHNITKATVTSALGFTPTSYTAATAVSAISTASSVGTDNRQYARADHVHNITGATITAALGFTPQNYDIFDNSTDGLVPAPNAAPYAGANLYLTPDSDWNSLDTDSVLLGETMATSSTIGSWGDDQDLAGYLLELENSITSGGAGVYVEKTGDTMTGDLSLSDSHITKDEIPTTTYYGGTLHLSDSNDDTIGFLGAVQYTNGTEGIQIGTVRTINNADYYHGFKLKIGSEGSRSVEFDYPAVWRSGLGAQATLISGTNIKTVNNISLLGSGNIEIAGSDNGVDPEIIVGSTQPTNTNARIWIIP